MHTSKWHRWNISVPSSLLVDEEALGTCWYTAQAWLPVLYFTAAESLSTIRLKRDIYLAYSLLSSFQEFVIWGRIHTCSKTFSSFVSWKRLVPPGKRPAFFFFKHLNLKSKKSAVSSGDLRADVRAQLQRPAHLSAWEHLFLPQPFGGGLCFGFLIMCLA